MPIACKICILTKGLKGSDIGIKGKTFETDEEFFEHLKKEHGIIVKEGEYADAAPAPKAEEMD